MGLSYIDRLRVAAQRTGQYSGQEVQWTADGETWVDVWVGGEAPFAARVGVRRDDVEGTMWGFAYSDRDKTSSPSRLALRAEERALCAAFPETAVA